MMSTPPATGFAARMAGVGLVVFLANAGLLVLQLVAGKLLSPFVGSSLSTWTVVIAAFLTGIAFGNAIGGRMADRSATAGRLVRFLISGALAALWMIAFPEILERTGVYRGLELDIRIPVLAFALCFPAGFTLSLLTPMAIRICVPDVGRAGSVSGLVFSLGTLGCLLGNYLTGFELIPNLELNWIVAAVAGLLVVTAAAVYAVVRNHTPPVPPADAPAPAAVAGSTAGRPLPLGLAFAIVFACSFAGMTLELSAVRLLAQVLGVSLFTWTGVIGVMLAGTAFGNLVGGRLADRASRSIAPNRRAEYLGWSLVFCGITTVLVILLFIILNQVSVLAVEAANGTMQSSFSAFGLIERVILWTFSLFFLPMFGLGLISPQVIRLAVPDVGSVGRVAGSIYAWSIGGAIAGTFATGYLLISSLGVNNTILLAAALPCVVLLLVRVVKPLPAGAVNDLSVPSHLMTKEFNAAVQKTLTPNGVYLVTVIDFVETGKLWKAAANTLRETFQHVELVFPVGQFDDDRPDYSPRSVIVLYASNAPLDGEKLRSAVVKQTGQEPITHIVARETLDLLLSYDRGTKEKLWPKLSADERARVGAMAQEMDEHARLKELLGSLRNDREKLEAQKGTTAEIGRLEELAKLDRQEAGLPERIAALKGKWAEWIRFVNETAQAKNIALAKKIILTDQFCPTDNLMIQVFKSK